MCGIRTNYTFCIETRFQALFILLCQIKHYHTISYYTIGIVEWERMVWYGMVMFYLT